MKRRALAEGGSVSIAEDEINALITPAPAPRPAPKPPAAEKAKPVENKNPQGPKPPEPPAAPAMDAVVMGPPNFRLRDGEMQVGVPVTLNFLGPDQRVIVQARGGFAKRGAVFVFEPTTISVGSLVVSGLPFVSAFVKEKISGAQAIPEDLAAAWPKLASVSVESNALKLRMP
jgi:hypothetical protein